MTKTNPQIRAVRTEQDYKAAVLRIEELMRAVPQTPDGKELDTLATLVEAYEAKYYAMDAPDPAIALSFRMQQQRLSR